MKVYTLEEAKEMEAKNTLSVAWMILMNEMDGLDIPDGSYTILSKYDWYVPAHFIKAQDMVLKLKACKQANEAIQVLGEHFIDEVLA